MDVSNHPIDFESMLKFSAEFSGDPIRGMSVLEKQFGLLQINNVYHYTDISGFISIMENHELWASHIAFMNDKSEYLHGKELFRERILQKIANVSEPEKQVLQNTIKSLDKEISDGVFPISSKDVFSISFSYNRDSLEMWRGYGKESGVAIGFDFSQCHSLPGMCLIRKEMYEKLNQELINQKEILEKVMATKSYDELSSVLESFKKLDEKFEAEKQIKFLIELERAEIQIKAYELYSSTHSQQKSDVVLEEYKKYKDTILSKIDVAVLENYKRIKENKGEALAKIENYKCSACNVAIPKMTVNEVRRQNQIIMCFHCGRILFTTD